VILPGATLGLLGGGQLGRMFTSAARTLGYRVTVVDPDPIAPAAEFATAHLKAPYADPGALDELARTCAAVTTEFENAPAEALDALGSRLVVRPAGSSVAVAQDRRREKGFFAEHGLPIGPWAPIDSPAQFDAALARVKLPALLKTARFGYDGKGQARIESRADLERTFAQWKAVPCVLEELFRYLWVIAEDGDVWTRRPSNADRRVPDRCGPTARVDHRRSRRAIARY